MHGIQGSSGVGGLLKGLFKPVAKAALTAVLGPLGPAAPLVANAGVDLAFRKLGEGDQSGSSLYPGDQDKNWFMPKAA